MKEHPSTSKEDFATAEGFERDGGVSTRIDVPPAEESELLYLSGWRLHLTTFGICLALYLVNLEVTIVSTSSLAIANDLNSFNKLGWVLTGYLITYTGFIMIWAKASDIFGQKPCFIATLALFIVFSAGCGAAQTINQLIICRVFQGVGAAGGFALGILFLTGMVPKEKYPLYGAIMAADIALANLSGPLLGGALSGPSKWRWVFLLNIPAGILAMAVLFISIPEAFPYHEGSEGLRERKKANKSVLKTSFKRIDVLGATLLLAGSLLLSTGLLEGGVQWEWKSAPSISILTISGVLLIAFFWWEKIVTSGNWTQEPVFPWRFLHNRVWMGVLLAGLLNGLPFYILVISLPQRFETVNGISPVQSGIRLLPYTLIAAFGSLIANGILSTGRIPAVYLMLFFSALGTTGVGLLTTIPATEHITKATYGYEALAGLGLGATWGLSIPFVGHVVEQRDIATACGALIEFRILGGALGLAIMSATMENYLKSHLPTVVGPEQLSALLKSTAIIHELQADVRAAVLNVFANGYTMQMKITTGFSAAQFLAIAMMWRNPQVMLVERKPKGEK